MILDKSPSPREGREQGRGRIQRARQLRALMTLPERKLWAYLRGHRFHGFQFKRQVPIGPYIVDYSCHARKLIIELDGGHHQLPDVKRYDRQRDEFLRAEGYIVLRFNNDEFRNNPDGVLQKILEVLIGPHH